MGKILPQIVMVVLNFANLIYWNSYRIKKNIVDTDNMSTAIKLSTKSSWYGF